MHYEAKSSRLENQYSICRPYNDHKSSCFNIAMRFKLWYFVDFGFGPHPNQVWLHWQNPTTLSHYNIMCECSFEDNSNYTVNHVLVSSCSNENLVDLASKDVDSSTSFIQSKVY